MSEQVNLALLIVPSAMSSKSMRVTTASRSLRRIAATGLASYSIRPHPFLITDVRTACGDGGEEGRRRRRGRQRKSADECCRKQGSGCDEGRPYIHHRAHDKPRYRRSGTITVNFSHAAGGWKDKLWPDEWTAVTLDGKRSAQFEETMVVTETGVDVLSAHKDWKLPS